jgi:hypothetical protein
MKCPNCLKENNYDARYCLYCGSQLSTQTQTNTAWGTKIAEAIKSKLFFALCVLMTVSTACLALSFSFNIIGILATIFLWILHSNAKKGTVSSKDLSNISGTIYASYIIDYILAGLMALLGIAFLLLAIFASNNIAVLEMLEDILTSVPEFEQIFSYRITAQLVVVFIWMFAILFLFGAVITIIVNAFGVRHIHRTVKMSYQSMDNPVVDPTKYANSARVWMWVIGVCTILSGLSAIVSAGFLAGVSGACQGVVYIIGAILVNRYLLTPPTEPQPVEPQPIQETIE